MTKRKILFSGVSKEMLYTLQLVECFLPYNDLEIYIYDHLSGDVRLEFNSVYGKFNDELSLVELIKFVTKPKPDAFAEVVICSDAYRSELMEIFKNFPVVQNWREFIVNNCRSNKKHIIPRVDIAVTQRCTLNCTHCNMYVPFVDNPADEKLDLILSDIDTLFNNNRYVGFVHLVGGEPFMFKNLSKVIDKLNGYKKVGKLCDIWITTNGAVKYKEADLICALNANSRIFVTDYSASINKVAELTQKNLKLLKQFFKKKIVISEEKDWIDFGDPRIVYETDELKLKNHFEKCTVPYRGLRDGRLYYCNLSIAASEAGFPQDIGASSISLTDASNEEILRYDLGDIGRNYLSLCKSCSGCNTGVGASVSPASQGIRS